MATKQASTKVAVKSSARKASKSATKAPAKKAAAKSSISAKKSTKTSAEKIPAKHRGVAKVPAKAIAQKSAAKSSTKVPEKRSAPKKTSTPDKYTDPALRERIKAKVVREGKGGKPGQWSARKAQMVAHEYEAEGGKYKGGRDKTQKSLTEWGDEHWTTQDGKPAGREDGMHRYLPEKAWEELSPAEKRATEKKKLAGEKKGKQFVSNTGPAVKARRDAQKQTGKR